MLGSGYGGWSLRSKARVKISNVIIIRKDSNISQNFYLNQPECARLKCGHDNMFIEFRSALLGLRIEIDPTEWSDREPVYDPDTDSWSLNCNLGECGMVPKLNDGYN